MTPTESLPTVPEPASTVPGDPPTGVRSDLLPHTRARARAYAGSKSVNAPTTINGITKTYDFVGDSGKPKRHRRERRDGPAGRLGLSAVRPRSLPAPTGAGGSGDTPRKLADTAIPRGAPVLRAARGRSNDSRCRKSARSCRRCHRPPAAIHPSQPPAPRGDPRPRRGFRPMPRSRWRNSHSTLRAAHP